MRSVLLSHLNGQAEGLLRVMVRCPGTLSAVGIKELDEDAPPVSSCNRITAVHMASSYPTLQVINNNSLALHSLILALPRHDINNSACSLSGDKIKWESSF